MSEIELRKLLAEFVAHENEPCCLDHHGYCQEHGWFGDCECLIDVARRALGIKEGETELPDVPEREIELLNGAVMRWGGWETTDTGGPSELRVSRDGRYINVSYGWYDGVFRLSPDTARSMASALNYFADKADKYKEGES